MTFFLILYVSFVLFFLASNILIAASIFYFLLNRTIKFWQVLKLHCAAVALNKILFTGSGYAAMIWKLTREGIPIHSCFVASMAQELVMVAPWIALGLYFGAHMAIRFPVVLFFLVPLVALLAVYKRKFIVGLLQNACGYGKEIKTHVAIVIPLVLANVIVSIAYYYMLFRVFSFNSSWLTTVKIASVAFTVGYLSPFPAGIGLKDGSLLLLLAQEGLSVKHSFFIALADRVLVTGLYVMLGFIFSPGLLRDFIRKSRSQKG